MGFTMTGCPIHFCPRPPPTALFPPTFQRPIQLWALARYSFTPPAFPTTADKETLISNTRDRIAAGPAGGAITEDGGIAYVPRYTDARNDEPMLATTPDQLVTITGPAPDRQVSMKGLSTNGVPAELLATRVIILGEAGDDDIGRLPRNGRTVAADITTDDGGLPDGGLQYTDEYIEAGPDDTPAVGGTLDVELTIDTSSEPVI